MWTYNHTNELRHFGVKGMRWGHRKAPDLSGIKTRAEKAAYSVGANLNPREAKYKVRKIVNRVNDNVESLANLTAMSVKVNGTLPTNQKALKADESVGINAHKKAVYKNTKECLGFIWFIVNTIFPSKRFANSVGCGKGNNCTCKDRGSK